MKKNKAYAESLTQYMLRLYDMIINVSAVTDLFAVDDNHEQHADGMPHQSAMRELLVVVTTDRGLAGAMNSNLLKYIDTQYADKKETTDIYVIGKKGFDFFTRQGYTIV